MELILRLIQVVSLLSTVLAFDWQDGADNAKWSWDCDFPGNDIDSARMAGQDCGSFCAKNSRCTHFSHYADVCHLRRFETPATAVYLQGSTCGWINRDVNPPASSQSGATTRYWDCCKPSCAWPGKGPVTPVKTCDKDGVRVIGNNEQSGCNGGPSYMCNNQMPWAINEAMSYGFAAFNGINGKPSCCKCYKLDFTSGPVVGKSMIVQVTNTGDDLGQAHFDLQIPGGGVGIFNGCSSQWGAPADGWGARYGGVSSIDECKQLPLALRPGCEWRFTWFKNADNPRVNFHEVTCPSELTAITGCRA